MSTHKSIIGKEYVQFLDEIKARIFTARIHAIRSVNKELIKLYWDIGKSIVERQRKYKWGNAVVEKLANDLQEDFKTSSGFSVQNLWYMRQFYLEYKDDSILQQAVGELPWGHNILIMQKVKNAGERKYYIASSIKFGWSRNVLLNQIKAGAYTLSLKQKIHNFHKTLPAYLNEQVKLKDENSSIGIILCAEKDNIVVEYALRSVKKPVGVAEYYLTKKLPKAFKGKLPNAQALRLSLQQEFKNKKCPKYARNV